MIMRRCVFCLALVILAGVCTADTKVSVEQMTYRGWKGSYRLTAGHHSLVVVPQIGGRIMEYSLNGRNVIWENPAEYGKLYSIEKVWRNYGGYKTWNSPEDRWGWPPDPVLDAGPATIEIKRAADGLPTLRIIGAPSLESGIMFTKEVTLKPDGRVSLVQWMHNISGVAQQYGVWDVTQVRTPCFVAFPVRADSRFPGGFKPMMKDSGKSKQWTSEDGLCIVEYQKEAGQIGADSPGPWMAWFKDTLAYVKLFGAVMDFSAYPDDGCSIELFTSKPELGYLEMEIMGPVVILRPGAETSIQEEWAICTLDTPIRDRASVKKAVEELLRRKAIP